MEESKNNEVQPKKKQTVETTLVLTMFFATITLVTVTVLMNILK